MGRLNRNFKVVGATFMAPFIEGLHRRHANLKGWGSKEGMNKSWFRLTSGLSCFYCGVDSKQLIALFLLTLGGGILGSVCMLLWSISKGDFKDIEEVKMKVLESEGISQKETSHEGQ